MLSPYLSILATPGAKRFCGAAFLARLPISIIGLGIILMVQTAYGSYGLGGGVSAAYVIAQAISSPQLARLVDRYGQRRIMAPAWAGATVGLAGMIAAGLTHAPQWVLFVAAIVGGACIGSVGSLVRTRWNHVLRNPADLHTAYSLESVLDECIFVVGPMLATLMATSVQATAGLWIPVILVPVGGAIFLAQRTTEPPPTPQPPTAGGSVMRGAAMITVMVVFAAMGAVFGANDIAVVAFSAELGAKSWSGALLACFAAGSMVAGLVYGARHWVTPLWRRFCLGAVAFAVGTAVFQAVNSLQVLAIVMFIVGGAIAPTIINGNAFVQQLVPPERLTEGLAWVGTCMGIGTSAGSWLSGVLVDTHGSHAGFLVVLGCGLLGLAAVGVGFPWLRRTGRRQQSIPSPEAEPDTPTEPGTPSPEFD